MILFLKQIHAQKINSDQCQILREIEKKYTSHIVTYSTNFVSRFFNLMHSCEHRPQRIYCSLVAWLRVVESTA